MSVRPRVLAAALIAAALIAGAVRLGAAAADGQPNLETLLDTETTNLGQPIRYPVAGAARITAVIVTLAPGEETGRHRHPVPLYGQVLSGQVTIDYGEQGIRTYRAGEAFMEAIDSWHNGRNSGEETLRILAIFIGAEGHPNVVRP